MSWSDLGGLSSKPPACPPRGEARSRPSNGRLVVLLVGQVLTHAPHLTPEQLVLFAAEDEKRARLDPTLVYLTPQPETRANNRCDLINGENNSFHLVSAACLAKTVC